VTSGNDICPLIYGTCASLSRIFIIFINLVLKLTTLICIIFSYYMSSQSVIIFSGHVAIAPRHDECRYHERMRSDPGLVCREMATLRSSLQLE
jgi:hypothetical protein